jgi:hypothetical protein
MRKSNYTRSLSFSLSQEHFDLIKDITDEEEISMSAWIRDAVEMALKDYTERHNVL